MTSTNLPLFGDFFIRYFLFFSILFTIEAGIEAQEYPVRQQDETESPNTVGESEQGQTEENSPGNSQNVSSPDDRDQQNPGQDESLTEESGEPEQKEIKTPGEKLIDKSLVLDINTATVEELVAWNQILDLQTYGDIASLRKQLHKYYGLISDSGDISATKDAGQIKIESADRTEYLTFKVQEGQEEAIIELSGRVEVSFEEAKLGRIHKIKADTIIFNRDNETISAIGNIQYTIDTDGREERFSGENLIFRTGEWTGVIFRGTSERVQKVKKRTVDFFFRGEDIIRPEPEIIVLNEGVITSDNNENPYYSLKAKKIWITGPGEWGMLDAVIYVGHVPTFYIPFYWKQGNDLIFNPVTGTQNRLGYYIQTTTYILGAKDYGDQFSIMGFGDSGSGNFKVEREGLFAVRKRLGAGEKVKSRNSLKYMLDLYTNLGVMTGFKGKFPSIGKLGLNFDARMAVSRSIDEDGNPNFSDDGQVRQYWHKGYLAGLDLPFRWYVTADMKYKSWSMKLSSYSDREFLNDFGERRENFDWLSFFLGEEAEPEKKSILNDSQLKIAGRQSLNTSKLSPWINSLSMSNFLTYIKWKTKTNNDPELKLDKYNPGKKFYYPHEIVIPKIEFSLSGRLPGLTVPFKREKDNSSKESGEDGKNEKNGKDGKKKPSDPESRDSSKKPDSVKKAGRFPEYYNTAISLDNYKNIIKASLDYKISNAGISIESFSDSSKWKKPQDIKFKFRPQRIKTTPSARLGYSLDFIDNTIKLSGNTKLSVFYQFYHDLFSSGIEITDKEKKGSYKYSKINWGNDLKLAINPLKSVNSLSSSTLGYSHKIILYKKEYDSTSALDNPQFTDDWFQEEKEYFKSHSVKASLNWKPGIFSTSSSVTLVLPPLDEKYMFSNALDFAYSGWKAQLSQKTDYQESKETPLQFKPLIFSLGWSGFKNKIKISQALSYDLQEGRMKEARSNLTAWGFKVNFVANYGKSYTWKKDSYTWKAKDESSFEPKSLALRYSLPGKKLYLWKNRITTKTTTSVNWNINLRKITENKLNFSISQHFAIYKFIDLKVSLTAENKAMFLYFPKWREELEIPGEYDFFLDLFKSFNIFDSSESDRKESKFNMKKLTISVVHHLKNWDLSFDYSGWPKLKKDENRYEWESKFSISLVWNPLPIFNQKTRYEKDEWSVESFKPDS